MKEEKQSYFLENNRIISKFVLRRIEAIFKQIFK